MDDLSYPQEDDLFGFEFKTLGETTLRAANGLYLGEVLIGSFGKGVHDQARCLGLCAAIQCENGDEAALVTPSTDGDDLLLVAFGNRGALESAAYFLDHFAECTECLDRIYTDLVQEAVSRYWGALSVAERTALCRKGECSLSCALQPNPPDELADWLEDEVYDL